jgi:hypothetical protein
MQSSKEIPLFIYDFSEKDKKNFQIIRKALDNNKLYKSSCDISQINKLKEYFESLISGDLDKIDDLDDLDDALKLTAKLKITRMEVYDATTKFTICRKANKYIQSYNEKSGISNDEYEKTLFQLIDSMSGDREKLIYLGINEWVRGAIIFKRSNGFSIPFEQLDECTRKLVCENYYNELYKTSNKANLENIFSLNSITSFGSLKSMDSIIAGESNRFLASSKVAEWQELIETKRPIEIKKEFKVNTQIIVKSLFSWDQIIKSMQNKTLLNLDELAKLITCGSGYITPFIDNNLLELYKVFTLYVGGDKVEYKAVMKSIYNKDKFNILNKIIKQNKDKVKSIVKKPFDDNNLREISRLNQLFNYYRYPLRESQYNDDFPGVQSLNFDTTSYKL